MLQLRKSVLCLAGAATLAMLSPMSGARADDNKITLAVPAINTGAMFAFIADAMGFWKDQGLEVDIPLIQGSASQAALNAGDVQISINTGPLTLATLAHDQHIEAIGDLYDALYQEIVISKKAADASGLNVKTSTVAQRAKALKGLAIAINAPNNITDLFLTHIARKGGVDPKDIVKPVMASTVALDVALAMGKIDGFSAPAPYTTKAVKDGSGVMWVSGVNGDDPDVEHFIYSVFTTRAGYCEKNPSTCIRFLTGVKRAVAFMHDNPQKSLEILTPSYKGIDPDLLKAGYDQSLSIIPSDLRMDEEEWRKAQEFDLEVGFLTPAQKFTKFEGPVYTNAYLK